MSVVHRHPCVQNTHIPKINKSKVVCFCFCFFKIKKKNPNNGEILKSLDPIFSIPNPTIRTNKGILPAKFHLKAYGGKQSKKCPHSDFLGFMLSCVSVPLYGNPV